MTAEQICKAAQNNDPVPADMLLSEQGLYFALRNIYDSYRRGVIDNKQGKREKLNAIKQYENLKLGERIYRRQAKMSVELGKLLTKANKEGCEICKQMAKLITGRLIVSGGDCEEGEEWLESEVNKDV